MLCRDTQDGWVMVESSTKHGLLEKGMANHYSILALRTQNGMTLKDEFPKSAGAQYSAGEEWRNSSRKNEEMEPKQKQHPVVNVMGDGNKI